MIELHPEILIKDGKKQVVLPYEEFTAIQEALADAEDLAELRTAKKEEAESPTVSLDEVTSQLGLSD